MLKFLFNVDVISEDKEVNKVNLLVNAEGLEEAQEKMHEFFGDRELFYSMNHQFIVHNEM